MKKQASALGKDTSTVTGSKQKCGAGDLSTHCKPSQGSHWKILPPTCFLNFTEAVFSKFKVNSFAFRMHYQDVPKISK